MKFLDEILRSNQFSEETKKHLDGITVVDCVNVSDYYWRGTDKEVWDLKDFPNMAPPWPDFWLDFSRCPRESISEVHGHVPWGPRASAWGLHIQGAKEEHQKRDFSRQADRDLFKNQVQRAYFTLYQTINRIVPDIAAAIDAGPDSVPPAIRQQFDQLMDVAHVLHLIDKESWHELQEISEAPMPYTWVLNASLYVKMPMLGTEPAGPIWGWRLFLNEDGSMATNDSGECMNTAEAAPNFMALVETLSSVADIPLQDAWLQIHGTVAPYLHCGLLSISFMHCQNIAMHDVTPPRHIVHNKNAKRRGEKDFQPVKFKTLNIQPMKETLRQAGQHAPSGERTTRALHFCRGHFRHYGPDKKLFGKYTGTFWTPLHSRGGPAKDAGVVQKDYRIKL